MDGWGDIGGNIGTKWMIINDNVPIDAWIPLFDRDNWNSIKLEWCITQWLGILLHTYHLLQSGMCQSAMGLLLFW